MSWYSRNPALLAAAASVSFPYRPGMFVDWANPSKEGFNVMRQAIPGIAVLEWVPTFGRSQNATDPASVVGKEMFAKVREKFSGSIDADAPDFVIYVGALDSIFSYIASLKRIYRILGAYTSENHYLPDAMMRALGFSEKAILNLMQHRIQLYEIINELVFMTRKFNVPAVFDYINRHYWLNDNVYMDADSINSQFYMFCCMGYYQYTLLNTPDNVQAGGLSMVYPTYPNTDVVEYLFTFGRNLINALAGSDDAYIISGYLMRAYEGTPVFTVDELPQEDKLIPHYDPEVLMQIENAVPVPYEWFGTSSGSFANDVTQDPKTNAVLCDPTISVNVPSYATGFTFNESPYLSIRSDAPSAADVTIATRLKMGILSETLDGTKWTGVINCASEVLIEIDFWNYRRQDNGTVYLSNFKLVGRNVLTSTPSSLALVGPGICAIQSYDWHPIIPLYISPNTDSGTIYAMLMGDVHNLTLLPESELQQINRVCLYSEFNSYGMI